MSGEGVDNQRKKKRKGKHSEHTEKNRCKIILDCCQIIASLCRPLILLVSSLASLLDKMGVVSILCAIYIYLLLNRPRSRIPAPSRISAPSFFFLSFHLLLLLLIQRFLGQLIVVLIQVLWITSFGCSQMISESQ